MLKWTVILLSFFLAAAQFVRPARTNPPVDETRTIESVLKVPPQVGAILDRSCRDCHTYKTRWPWYSNVAPASWIVISDVNKARSEVNLSDWARYAARAADHRLEEMCEMVETGVMPLRSYTLLHPGTSLTDVEVRILCDWTRVERQRLDQKPERKAEEKNQHRHRHE